MERLQRKKRFDKYIYVAGAYGGLMSNKKYIEDKCIEFRRQYPTYLFINGVSAFGYMYDTETYKKGLDMTLELMLDMADEVWTVGDYSKSIGTNVEIAVAREYGIPIRTEDELNPIEFIVKERKPTKGVRQWLK